MAAADDRSRARTPRSRSSRTTRSVSWTGRRGSRSSHRRHTSYGGFIPVRWLGQVGKLDVFLGERTSALGSAQLALLKVAERKKQNYAKLKSALVMEGRIAERLKHPGIVRLLNADENEGGFGLVYENVEGINLAQLCATGLPFELAAWLTAKFTRALELLHAKAPGVLLPRELSENLLLGHDGRLQLATFALDLNETEKGAEQLNVVSAGALLFELLGGTQGTAMGAQLQALGVPEALIEISLRAMRAPRTAADLSDALEAWLGPSSQLSEPLVERFLKQHQLVEAERELSSEQLELRSSSGFHAIAPRTLSSQIRNIFTEPDAQLNTQLRSETDLPTVEIRTDLREAPSIEVSKGAPPRKTKLKKALIILIVLLAAELILVGALHLHRLSMETSLLR